MARELFAAGFVSCWAELEEGMREALVRSLEAALASPSIPAEIVTTLLNLAEFMEHNEKKLPLDTRQVNQCHVMSCWWSLSSSLQLIRYVCVFNCGNLHTYYVKCICDIVSYDKVYHQWPRAAFRHKGSRYDA